MKLRRFLACYGILVSLMGLYLTVEAFSASSRLKKHAATAPYAETAFAVLFTLSSLIVIALAVTSIQLLIGKNKSPLPFCIAALAPVPLFFITGASWLLPWYGRSIATVTGVAMMPLTLMLFSLIWLLAPCILMIWPGSAKEEATEPA